MSGAVVEIEPLNEDEEGVVYFTKLSLEVEPNADLIAEIIDADPNRIFCINWRNASLTMRAGSWAAMFQRDVL